MGFIFLSYKLLKKADKPGFPEVFFSFFLTPHLELRLEVAPSVAETPSPRKTGINFDLKNFNFLCMFFNMGMQKCNLKDAFNFFPQTRMPRKSVGALMEMFISIGSSVYRIIVFKTNQLCPQGVSDSLS